MSDDKPAGRCSSTSCASWRSGSPTSPATSISTRRTHAHVPRVGRAVEPGRAVARRERRAQGRPRRDRAAERVLPAVDRRVRRGAQGGRGDGAREHAPVDAGDDRDPRPRRDLGDVHVRRPARARACGTGERAVAAIDRVRRRPRRDDVLGWDDEIAGLDRERDPGAGRRRRHGRHHVHVGHHRPAEGRARTAPQRRDDPATRRRTGRAGAGCTARRCSRSRA